MCDGLCVDLNQNLDYCGACDIACAEREVCDGGVCRSACLESEELCDDGCAFVATDANHCGRCGNTCVEDQRCVGGDCVCNGSTALCGEVCADLLQDKEHCGSCATACKIGEECVGGGCVPLCAGGAAACDGLCVDTTSDDNYCGDCETSCSRAQTCVGSSCVCANDRDLCDGECVDTDTNIAHCGGCDDPCPLGANCRDGDCDCPAGRELCDGRCVDVLNDADFCGDCDTDCADEVCVSGDCQAGCPDGSELCPDGCVDVDVDPQNCTDCGVQCRADQECGESGCACPEGLEECDGRCVDTLTTDEFCGDCVTSCENDQSCRDGDCTCAGDLIECDGSCVDTKTDEAHCGGCPGDACDLTEICSGSVCMCSPGLTDCAGECVDLDSDPLHCRGCGQDCDPGEICSATGCVADCELPQLECDGACVDVTSNDLHCGDCDDPCASNETCSNSDCACVNDFFEPSNSLDETIILDIGTAGFTPHLTDLRLCGDDVDWFTIPVPTNNASLEIFLDADCRDEILPRMTAFAGDGTTELQTDEADGSGSCPALFLNGLSDINVNLRIESTVGDGSYGLLVFYENLVESEPNDDPDNANGPFSADVDVSAELAAAGGDFDTYLLYVPRPSTLVVETTDGLGSCAVDTYLWATDDVGGYLGESDDDGNGLCSRLSLDVPTGYVNVSVFGFDVDDTGPYELEIRFFYDVEFEPNSFESPDGPFVGSFGAEGVVFPAFDADYYAFELTQTSTVVAAITGKGFGCLVDSVIELWELDTPSFLGLDDDFDESSSIANTRGLGYCSIINPTAPSGPDQSWAEDLPAGDYMLIVYGYSDRIGAYNLSVEVVP